MSNISASSTNKDDKGVSHWEKTIKDVNNVDEKFSNARDLGYTRLNYARVSAVGKLAKSYDKYDMYKIQVQSNGKLGLSIKGGDESDKKVLDLSKYEAKLDELKQITDPTGWAEEQKKKIEEDLNKDTLATEAPGLKVEVYTMKKNGQEVLVGDSKAEKGSKTRDALESMLKGEYKASKDTIYYVKVSRDDTVGKNEELPYVMQIQQGEKYLHDYISKEQVSDDTKSKTESKIPLTQGSASGSLSSVNALQIQASKYQATAQMLAVGYMNMADIYNHNSKY